MPHINQGIFRKINKEFEEIISDSLSLPIWDQEEYDDFNIYEAADSLWQRAETLSVKIKNLLESSTLEMNVNTEKYKAMDNQLQSIIQKAISTFKQRYEATKDSITWKQAEYIKEYEIYKRFCL